MTQSLVNIIDIYLNPYKDEDNPRKVNPKDIENQMTYILTFSIIWSIGAVLGEASRSSFNVFFADLINGENVVEKYELIDVDTEWKPNKLEKLKMNENMFNNSLDIDMPNK